MPGKRAQFDQETWNALGLLASDSIRDFQELADGAFADFLKRHGRPADLTKCTRWVLLTLSLFPRKLLTPIEGK
jgi:hypothetical protein